MDDNAHKLDLIKSILQSIGRTALRHKAVPSQERQYKDRALHDSDEFIWAQFEQIGKKAIEAIDLIDDIK